MILAVYSITASVPALFQGGISLVYLRVINDISPTIPLVKLYKPRDIEKNDEKERKKKNSGSET